MRVSFSIDLKPQSGKQNFAVQLAKEFKKKGIKVTNRKPHINLVFVKGVRKGCKNILRLDGAWMNTRMNYKSKNNKIAGTMKRCNGVIYQSKYSKKVCEKFIGKHKNRKIIHNGCDPSRVREQHQHRKPYILACSRWRPHKRLAIIIEGFLSSGLCNDYDLVICGEPDVVVKHPSIVYVGKQKVHEVYKITAGCTFAVHLAYLDCCPNSVVESLVAGKKVLFAKSGGVSEIVRDSGVGIEEEEYTFTAVDLYSPPPVSIGAIVAGYKELVKSDTEITREDLYISNIADQYIRYMERIV